MQEIKRVITELSGNRGKECYYILCCAVKFVRDCQPEEPQMKAVCEEVRKETGKNSSKTVSKALSRAVDDIWEEGDHKRLEEIYGRPVLECPSPRELILRVAQYVWVNSSM